MMIASALAQPLIGLKVFVCHCNQYSHWIFLFSHVVLTSVYPILAKVQLVFFQGLPCQAETNVLRDGTMIDLCGATLLWRSAEGLKNSPVSAYLLLFWGLWFLRQTTDVYRICDTKCFQEIVVTVSDPLMTYDFTNSSKIINRYS